MFNNTIKQDIQELKTEIEAIRSMVGYRKENIVIETIGFIDKQMESIDPYLHFTQVKDEFEGGFVNLHFESIRNLLDSEDKPKYLIIRVGSSFSNLDIKNLKHTLLLQVPKYQELSKIKRRLFKRITTITYVQTN